MAINWDELKHTNRNVTFFDDHKIVSRYNIDLFNSQHLLPSLVKLSKMWSVPYDAIINFVIQDNITKDLFEYITYPHNNKTCISERYQLVYQKGFYSETYKWQNGFENKIITYYDVYIKESNYIGLKFNKIIKQIIEVYYPYAYVTKITKPYENIDITKEMSISDINDKYKQLTANDILIILSNDDYKNILENEIAYNIYSNGDCIYYPLPSIKIHGHKYDRSLYIPCDAIVKKDWSIVENYFVYSIIKPSANEKLGMDKNNWFQGKQKDAPYFNCSEVREIQKLFKQ